MSEVAAVVRHPKRWLILVVLMLATLVLVVDNMALNVAIPPLTEDLGATAQEIQWIIASYILVFAGLLLTSGSLGDRFGRRKLMIIGLVVFGLASLAAAFSKNPEQLIAARTLMGVGGALVMPSTLSILITVFEEDERRKAMSAWGAVSMVGLIGGPVAGGAIIAHFWWGAVFLINVPIAAIAIAAALVWMPESKAPAGKPDVLGAILSVIGMVSLTWAITEMPKGLDRASTLAAFGVAIVALTSFVIWQVKNPNAMVPMNLFRKRNFAGGSLALTLVQIGNGGLLLVLTQYVQFVMGYTPTEAGLAFIPLAIAALVFNGVGAALGAKVGNRVLTFVGLLTIAGAFIYLANAGEGFWPLALAMGLIGAGSGVAMPAAIGSLMGEIPPEKAGVGSALNDTIQQAGAALGVAILGSLLTAGYTDAMPESAPEQAKASIGDAFGVAAQTGDTGLIATAREAFVTAQGTTFLISAGMVVAAAILAVIVLRDKKKQPGDETPQQDPELVTAA
ncbi:MFS transporter [Actinorhabdospora filicis]|uniref:MFS transporter n=1 Tax=Actinorhabdospora filicis TaxID=1785913 RepID=A0A9W6W2W4_9ACTN|nr:MFS transporter [Actinorhabdospora filicis]GLZ77467.1 MFS transporter [Actinorhabdospora filicis]